MEPAKADPTVALHLQEGARRGFDEVVEAYGARPEYPPELIGVLQERCGVRSGSRVLEVGPGTGQVTIPLAALGAEVVVVELGASMGERLRQAAVGLPVEVVIASFEETDVPDAFFDAVVSATAFHWIDPRVGYPKAARALRDEGWLAVWWMLFDQPDRPDGFFGDLQPLLAGSAPEVLAMLGGPAVYARDVAARRGEFSAVGQFGPVEMFEFSSDVGHTPSQLRALFATYSPVMTLPHDRRERLLDDIEELAGRSPGGVTRRSYSTVMYLAQRQGR